MTKFDDVQAIALRIASENGGEVTDDQLEEAYAASLRNKLDRLNDQLIEARGDKSAVETIRDQMMIVLGLIEPH